MTSTTGIRHRDSGRARTWIVILLVAIGVHALLFLTVQQSFFDLFSRSAEDRMGTSSPAPAYPDAIIAVTLEIEGEEREVVIEEPREPPPERTSTVDGRGDSENDAIDILDIVGESQAMIPSSPSSSTAIVPPRPLEITWPETEKLGHCLGLRIAIRIRVDERGEIIRVESVDPSDPADCTRAAISAARRIRFRPGTIDGKRAAMWTQIRIDFRRGR